MPEHINFTKATLDSLPNSVKGKRTYYLDENKKSDDIKGFGVVVEHNGKKHFVLTQYFKRDRQTVRLRCGEWPLVKIDVARNRARELQHSLISGIHPRDIEKQKLIDRKAQKVEDLRGSVTLKDVWDEYIEANKSNWSESHYKDHQKSMQPAGLKRRRSNKKTVAGVLNSFSAVRLADFTSETIVRWIEKEKKTRPTVTARGYRLLRACLNWADGEERYQDLADVDRLFKNGMIRKSLPKIKAKQDALESQHLPHWFKAVRMIDNPVISAYLQGLLITGARREELAGLKWEDADFQWNSVRIKDKVEGERVIPLTPYLANLLNALPRRNEWVFSSPQSESGRLRDPYRKHVNALALAGLPPVSLHGLRRSFGSLSEWVECPVGVVAQIQGHKPSAIAEKHYRVRPLDLLRLWHTRIEAKILEFAGVEQPTGPLEHIRAVR